MAVFYARGAALYHRRLQALLSIAKAWTEQEPNSTDAWFYLAAAEYATQNTSKAEDHLRKVVAMNSAHSQAIYYLGMIAEKSGNHTEALTNVALLNSLDADAAEQLKLAMGITPEPR